MFDVNRALVLSDRRLVGLQEIAGRRGLVVAGVGRGGERGFQMVHRFHDVGEQLAVEGIHLAFIYPRESARHVLDAISVASTRFRKHPQLLLDVDGCCFARGLWPRSIEAVCLDFQMNRLAGATIDLRDATWECELRTFFAHCRTEAGGADG